MNYIIYDLEFNQKYETTKDKKTNVNDSKLQFEIIQIGALKLNDKLEVIDTFNSLIKPNVHLTIHPYVEALTKITNDDLSTAKSFIKVYKEFVRFIGDDEYLFGIWGMADIKELIKNINYYSLPSKKISKEYIDIQLIASTYLNVPKNSRVSLSNAVDFLNIETKGTFHDAFNDAYYTSEVFKKLYTTNIEVLSYTPVSPRKNERKPKEIIDTEAIIRQFEKMYNRKMSNEEKEMIKLSYIMGKTNQFTKKKV